jgi:small-conductance mechanosensitive channel
MTLILILAIIVGYLLALRFVNATIASLGRAKAVNTLRIKYISKTLNLALTGVFLMLLLVVMGIEYSQLSVFLSSVFAVIGVALFAQWSILSNVTASLIIFFGFPYRVGDRVRVVDGDEDITGVIEEIALFHVIIRRGNDMVTYPNSLILQKAVIKFEPDTAGDEALRVDA